MVALTNVSEYIAACIDRITPDTPVSFHPQIWTIRLIFSEFHFTDRDQAIINCCSLLHRIHACILHSTEGKNDCYSCQYGKVS